MRRTVLALALAFAPAWALASDAGSPPAAAAEAPAAEAAPAPAPAVDAPVAEAAPAPAPAENAPPPATSAAVPEAAPAVAAPAAAAAETISPAPAPAAAEGAAAPAGAPATEATSAPAAAPEPASPEASPPASEPAAVASAAPAPAAPRPRLPRWGVALGAGFPEFVAVDAMYRPWRFLRLRAGPSWNTVAFGIHGGVELVPVNWAITPVLALHGGKFLRSDFGRYLKGDDADVKPIVERIDYSYAAVDLGLELGSPRGFSVALRAGLSFVSVSSGGSATYADDDGRTVTMTKPSLAATLPSAKLTLQYWF
jgi:hypothetical protein